jgi:uncharacterized protein
MISVAKHSGLREEDVKEMQQIFRRFPLVKKVLLFGSRAMGNFKRGSDVDITLKGNIDHSTLSEIRNALGEESKMPYFFDVLVYNEIEKEELRKHIDTYGVMLYENAL